MRSDIYMSDKHVETNDKSWPDQPIRWHQEKGPDVMDPWDMGGGIKAPPNPAINESVSTSHPNPGVCVVGSAPSYPVPSRTILRGQGLGQHQRRSEHSETIAFLVIILIIILFIISYHDHITSYRVIIYCKAWRARKHGSLCSMELEYMFTNQEAPPAALFKIFAVVSW